MIVHAIVRSGTLIRASKKTKINFSHVLPSAPRHIVRGYGPLDLYLAKKRCKMAVRHLREVRQRHRILDIGCGAYPLFLTQIDFVEKYGVDQNVPSDLQKFAAQRDIALRQLDFHKESVLPWESNFFDVVSMLAVFEHIEPDNLPFLLGEIYRVLKPHGRYIITTPAPWAAGVLWFLAKARVISSAEIADHRAAYNHQDLKVHLANVGFEGDKMKFGYFELFLNLWAYADK
jgi:SAM-dependent methyltransferase